MRLRWTNLPLRTKVFIVLTVPIVPLAIFAAFVIANSVRERDTEAAVLHALAVKSHLRVMVDQSNEADASALGFLLTRDPASLQAFMDIGKQWPETVKQLAALVADNPKQVEILRRIAARKDNRPLVMLLEHARSTVDPPSPSLLQTSRQQLNEFLNDLAAMQSLEDAWLTDKAAEARHVRNETLLLTLLAGLVGFVGALTAASMFSGGVASRIDRARINAERLSTGTDLVPFQEADDEVGALERGMRDAHGLLRTREAELRQRMSELTAVNEELEAFSYSVSHDLRAPLRHITGFVALLEESATPKLDDEERRRFRTIADAATMMGRLIDDLLAFSRIGRASIARQRVSLDDVVREARKEVEKDGERGSVAWSIQPLPDVDGDPALLRQVFINLLGNAVKYTRERTDAQIEVGTNGHAPGEAVVFVRDNGVGFDMKYAHKLFGVFQRLHRPEEFEGTGIGLANVRRIVHRHGGRTWAEGAVNAGATFYMSFPLPAGGPTT